MPDFDEYLNKTREQPKDEAIPLNVVASDYGVISEETKRAIRELGRQGGNKTLAKHGTAHFSHAGKIGAEKRWGKTRGASK